MKKNIFYLLLYKVKNLTNIDFMDDNSVSNNIESDESDMNNDESDYENLILRLKEMRLNIALLEQTITR